MTHWVPSAVVVAYVVALFAVTWWARRLSTKQGIVGYLLAGRALPSYVSAALLAGLAVGGASTIGVAERAYSVGLSAGWYNAAWSAGAFVLGLGAAKRFRRFEISTLPELFERHYSVGGRLLGVVGQLVVQVVVTSLQYVAGGAILHSLMPGLPGLESLGLTSFHTGMLITACVFVGITLIGGFWAAGLTNVVNVLVIYVGIVLGAVLTVGRLGGLGALTTRLPEAHGGFDLAAVGPGIIAAWFIVMITQVHSTQSVIQIGFATKDEKSAARGYLLGGAIILPVGFISAIIGMAAAVLHPGIVPAEALPAVVLELPPLAAGVILAGLWAADVSTASALLMGSATLVCGDLIKRFIAPTMSATREQLICRLTVAGLSVVTFLLALTVTGILKFLLVGLTLSTAYTLVVLATIYAPGICRKGSAFWTLLMTMLALAGWLLMPGQWRFLPHPIYFTWIVSLVTFAVVALVDQRKIDLAPSH
jgi:solute:Na+ symporter, SSS family